MEGKYLSCAEILGNAVGWLAGWQLFCTEQNRAFCQVQDASIILIRVKVGTLREKSLKIVLKYN